jgi:YHS domain-containing protein
LFANTENQQKFEAAPDQYGIQFDGYCMKMGPLSGRGSSDRWFVSEGRIYLFASESCREKFKLKPAAYTDHADLPPTGNAVSKRRGRELVWLALKGFGGVEKVDAVTNVQWESITVYEQGEKKTEMHQTATVVLPNQLRLGYSYGDFRETHALTNGQLLEISAKNEVTPLPTDVYEFVRRRLYREPLALLRVRNDPGFVAFAAGSGEVDGRPVEWLNVGYAGATTKLEIDPASGRILAAVYPGRAPSKLGQVRRTFSDFKPMEGGLILPQQWEVTYEGLPAEGPKPASRSVAINVPIAAR